MSRWLLPQERAVRNAALVALGKTGDYQLRELAELFDISYQRAGQILAREGVILSAIRAPRLKKNQILPCPACGKLVRRGERRAHWVRGAHNLTRLGMYNLYPGRSAAIAADYEAGMKWGAICAKYGVKQPTIRLALIEQGIPLRRLGNHMAPTREETVARELRIVADLDHGFTPRETAVRQGVSDSLVYRVRKHYGGIDDDVHA